MLSSLFASAQVSRTVTFDFRNLASFSSSPQMSASSANITGTTLTNGDVQISFDKGWGQVGVTYEHDSSDLSDAHLYITRGAHVYITGLNNASLTKITYPSTDTSGDLYLPSDSPGSFVKFDKTWTSGSENVSSVKFENSGAASKISGFTVTYTLPSSVLAPSSYSPVNGSTVSSFKQATLDFGRPMSVVSTSGLSLSNGQALSATASGNSIILSVDTEITADGSYTITIPAGCFQSSDGFVNRELTYSFTVSTPFMPSDITPAAGTVESLAFPLTLTFDSPVMVVDGKEGTLVKDGKDSWGKVTFQKNGIRQVLVNAAAVGTTPITASTDSGTYTVSIPDGAFTDADGNRHNSPITLVYNVRTDQPVTPDPPTKKDSEAMAAAKALLNDSRIGTVGYPSAEGEAYKTLAELATHTFATAEDSVRLDDSLTVAMSNLYADANITLPAAGKYYKIYGVNNGSAKAYLHYAEGAVTLSDKAGDATTFEAEDYDGGVAFKTNDGKYLHVLYGENNKYDAVADDKNVTDSKAEVSKLTVAKLTVAGVDAKDVFGLVSLHGALGTRKTTGKQESAYALVDYSNGLAVSTDPDATVLFGPELSSAFRMEEGGRQPDGPQVVETEFELAPANVKKGELLTLTVKVSGDVTLSSSLKPDILRADGSMFSEGTTIYQADSPANAFRVVFTDCVAGDSYKLSLPEGLFSYTLNGSTALTQATTLDFTVTDGGSTDPDTPSDDTQFGYLTDYPNTNMVTVSSSVVGLDAEQAVADADLNNFILSYSKSDISGLVPNDTVTVGLYRNADKPLWTLLTTGHFVTTTLDDNDYSIRLVLDNPIARGSLQTGLYAISYPDATFGDANFGLYLDGNSSVKKSDCKVNRADHWYLYVNNSLATAISSVKADKEGGTAIYDLQGRRLEKMVKPGIYIVNGKKVIKR